MSHFLLKDVEDGQSQGIVLKGTLLSEDVLKAIRKAKCLRWFDSVYWVMISECKSEGRVLLEVRANNIFDNIRRKLRSNVFYVGVKANPEWVCEGNYGRGERVKLKGSE